MIHRSGRRATARVAHLLERRADPGTCLYALVDGHWSCYSIRPNASADITAAETWLRKRSWQAWG